MRSVTLKWPKRTWKPGEGLRNVETVVLERVDDSQHRLILGDALDVSLVLSSDGKIVGRPQISGAQGQPFMEAAQAAIESIPFPPFPTGSKPSEVQFRFRVDYKPE